MRLNAGPSLDQLRATLSAKVDAEAETCRQRFITPGAGQAMEYQATAAEAEAFLAATNPEAMTWPWLEAERLVAGDTMTLLEVAQLAVTLRDSWTYVGSTIKALRRGAKVAIAAANTPSAIRDAARVTWPTP